jgi:hypothetical protein
MTKPPLPPLERKPAGPHLQRDERRAMLLGALAGVDLGAWDRHITNFLADRDPGTVRTIASLIQRARAAERQQAEQTAIELLASASDALERLHQERAGRAGR